MRQGCIYYTFSYLKITPNYLQLLNSTPNYKWLSFFNILISDSIARASCAADCFISFFLSSRLFIVSAALFRLVVVLASSAFCFFFACYRKLAEIQSCRSQRQQSKCILKYEVNVWVQEETSETHV